jgi:MscS family membrane protein
MSVFGELKNIIRLVTGLVIACVLTFTIAASTLAQEEVETEHQIEAGLSGTEAESSTFRFVSTDSTRDTLNSFIRLTWLLESAILNYQQEQTRSNYHRITQLTPGFLHLLDLSEVPRASRRTIGIDTVTYLLDIIGRIDLPPLEEVPDKADFEEGQDIAVWLVPGTPLRISRIGEGPRVGEFLFSGRTVDIAPWVYERMEQRALRSTLIIDSWIDALPQLHGPLIPAGLVSLMPESLKRTWLDTPLWKILATVLLIFVATVLLILWHRMINMFAANQRISGALRDLLSPIAVIAVTLALTPIITNEIDVRGQFAQAVDFTTTSIIYISVVWAFWLGVKTVSEWIILSPRIPEGSLDANLLRLTARVVGIVGSVLILTYGAQEVGLPVFGLVAGLGVGGLAVALALRPTLENLIGGAILYMDRPVRIGDFCNFGNYTGTVESIGVRSTQIRTIDRTLVTVPNANFANMEITNWASCDRMLIRTTIGVRYETSPDQLRYLLSGLRNMCYAHPKIDRETVRIRYIGYGPSSRDIDFRIYALTRDWSEFFAIREDIFLRVDDIVAESGTSFAYPSQTLYMGRDDGLDEERCENAEKQVNDWRRSGNLPFPGPTEDQIDKLAGTLDFPPGGAPSAHGPRVLTQEAVEPLSMGAESEDDENEKVGRHRE